MPMRLLGTTVKAFTPEGVRDQKAEHLVPGRELDLELTHVGPYEVIAPIGAGGTGKVYKVIDRARDRTAAIKVLTRERDFDEKHRKRDYLGHEVRIAASLRHDAIIRMHNEIIEQEDSGGNVRRCLLMEYVDGHNLRKYIRERSLGVPRMIRMCIKLCEGLAFLHQKDVVHGDVKPENFLCSRDGSQVKIVDFGLSKSNASWRARWANRGGGTRSYMSPEQLEKRSLDARSDIFSMGITMYELFSGRHPCSGRDSKEVMRQIRSSRYRFGPPSKHNPEIPAELDRIILKALRRRLERRYQSFTEMILDMTRIAGTRI